MYLILSQLLYVCPSDLLLGLKVRDNISYLLLCSTKVGQGMSVQTQIKVLCILVNTDCLRAYWAVLDLQKSYFMATRALLYISNYTIQVAALLPTHEAGKRLIYPAWGKNLLLKCSTSKMQPMTSSLTSWQVVDQNSRQTTIFKI